MPVDQTVLSNNPVNRTRARTHWICNDSAARAGYWERYAA